MFNGSLDKLLSTQWDEHIETILPARIATLNFFDGEKIESLADPLKSSEVIGSAIDNLLGVGLLNKLAADLKTYIRRTSSDVVDVSANEELDAIDQDLQILDQELAEIVKMKGLRGAQLNVISAQLAEIDAQATTFGSDQWSRREALEKQKQEIQLNSREHEDSLMITASGSEPLKLIKALIEQTLEQAVKDSITLIERQVIDVLAGRDSLVLELLDKTNRAEVEQFLESDRAHRHQSRTRIVLVLVLKRSLLRTQFGRGHEAFLLESICGQRGIDTERADKFINVLGADNSRELLIHKLLPLTDRFEERGVGFFSVLLVQGEGFGAVLPVGDVSLLFGDQPGAIPVAGEKSLFREHRSHGGIAFGFSVPCAVSHDRQQRLERRAGVFDRAVFEVLAGDALLGFDDVLHSVRERVHVLSLWLKNRPIKNLVRVVEDATEEAASEAVGDAVAEATRGNEFSLVSEVVRRATCGSRLPAPAD